MSTQSSLDEFYVVKKLNRIAFLELEIQKIKSGATKGSQEVLKDVLAGYEKELAELKR